MAKVDTINWEVTVTEANGDRFGALLAAYGDLADLKANAIDGWRESYLEALALRQKLADQEKALEADDKTVKRLEALVAEKDRRLGELEAVVAERQRPSYDAEKLRAVTEAAARAVICLGQQVSEAARPWPTTRGLLPFAERERLLYWVLATTKESPLIVRARYLMNVFVILQCEWPEQAAAFASAVAEFDRAGLGEEAK